MEHEIPALNRKELRQFGLMTGGIVAVLFGLILPLLWGHGLVRWPWIVAATLALWAIAAPGTLNPVYRIWMRFGLVMGFINTRIILGIIFYGLMWPMGAMMRLLGHDPMHRQFEGDRETYRLPTQPRLKKSMENPY
jgi:hypothetical protein